MRYIVCYDIKEDAIRARLVKYLEARALRIQFSVFTSNLSAAEASAMQEELLRLTQGADCPLIMIVPVCKACEKNIWMHGKPLEEEYSFLLV
mgnify:CR=1 FL=1